MKKFKYHHKKDAKIVITKMECEKIKNLLGAISDNVSKFITKKWINAHG